MGTFMKIAALGTLLLPAIFVILIMRKPRSLALPLVQTVDEILQFFPSSKNELTTRVESAINEAKESLNAIYAIEPSKRTFDNTMRPLDISSAKFGVISSLTHLMTFVSPNEELRKSAEELLVKLQAFSIDQFSMNPRLYEACKQYEERLSNKEFTGQEALSDEKKYYIEQTMKYFRLSGLDKPADVQDKIKAIQKDLAEHDMAFIRNISAAQKTLEVHREELAGWDDAAIDSLKKSESGKYILTLDGPTFDRVSERCAVGATRKAYFKLYAQRAYPANLQELGIAIQLRDRLAHLLDRPSFAHLDIETEMAHTPEAVKAFLDELAPKAQAKVMKEIELLKKNLPAGVELSEDGKFFMWDLVYVRNEYKKKYLAVDESYIAEFFPVDTTLPALLNVYEQFFGLHFKKVENKHAWHADTQLLAVYKDGIYRGTVILDIYPRPFKYTHACELTVIPSMRVNGRIHPALVTVIANFPPAQGDKPALLKRQDMITFFHEFGHAIHALLGSTEMASFSGAHVKSDFVEMPSQMLENWMWDAKILKMVSSHYKTKEPLSDELIEKIRRLKNFDSGSFVSAQLALAHASLAYFLQGEHKDVPGIWMELQKKYRPYLVIDKDYQYYCGFGHLANPTYVDKYYSYLWSLVYAADMFDYIKNFGLLNPEIGNRYINEVIGKGGSEDPRELITKFLGRKPTSSAFFRDLGLS